MTTLVHLLGSSSITWFDLLLLHFDTYFFFFKVGISSYSSPLWEAYRLTERKWNFCEGKNPLTLEILNSRKSNDHFAIMEIPLVSLQQRLPFYSQFQRFNLLTAVFAFETIAFFFLPLLSGGIFHHMNRNFVSSAALLYHFAICCVIQVVVFSCSLRHSKRRNETKQNGKVPN